MVIARSPMTMWTLNFRGKLGRLEIVARINSTVRRIGLIGPNGSGKTTFLTMLTGGLPALGGSMKVNSHDWLNEDLKTVCPIEKRGIGWQPQGESLFEHLNVLDNLRLALYGLPEHNHATEKLESVIDSFDCRHLLARKVNTISSGERQRIALARALLCAQEALVLDEPLSEIDPRRSRALRQFTKNWQAGFNGPTIVCSHNPADIFELADELWIIEAGKLRIAGSVAAVIQSPACDYSDAFFQHFNPK